MHPLKGIFLKLASVALFVVMAAMVKAAVAHDVPPGEAVFFRSALAIPVILVWLRVRGEFSTGLRMASPGAHLLRGLFGTAAMGMFFAALGLLPLPEVTALGYTAPLLTVIFAALFLGERLRLFRLGAVVVGFAGVLIMLSPRIGAFDAGALGTGATLGAGLVLLGATFRALAQIAIRHMVATEGTGAIVFWFSVTSAVLSLLTLPFGWVVPTGNELWLLVGAGLLGGVAQIFLTSAYRFAHASVVAPFDYASMLVSIAIGYAVFDEAPTWPMLGGAALVIAAGIVIMWRENRLGMARDRARAARTPQG
ncbi:DMT family transporter [Roseovarius salinarum]|uniref:DMT family transporter n=1 Tax=Roseovarius salinarum TaxID=1981892 RepID=UPI000C348F67|nr:DMT family transporter [Roseovarius salinarum]